ncbi:MAG TPA: Gldg family protein [Planctomycetaceae bacterium]|nr:Gldg family protein [Planctomycetaceae bacterium]
MSRVGLFAAIVAAANVACIYGLPAEIDLTHRGTFTLAPQTRNLLASLREPVEVTLLAPARPTTAGEHNFNNAALMLCDLLELCREVQPLVHVEQLDATDSAAARALQERFPDAVAPCVLVRYGPPDSTNHDVLFARDLAQYQAANAHRLDLVEFSGEQAFVAALTRLMSGKKQVKLYIVTGHGELALDDAKADSRYGIGLLADPLRAVDGELAPLDLTLEPRVPHDAGLVVVAGGQRPWNSAEAEKLGQYLRRGGKALVLIDLNFDRARHAPAPSGLEELLSEFGVAAGEDRVITRGFTGQFEIASPARPAEGDHALVRSLPQAPLTLFECRSLRSSTGLRQLATRLIPLLISHAAPRAWADGDFERQGQPEPGGANDSDGPVTMAVAVERTQGETPAPALVVVGDAEFVSNRVLSGPDGRVNTSFVLACVNWLRGRKELWGDIPPRRHEGYRLAGSPDDHRGLVWKTSLILVSLIASAGITVWTSRRRG